MAETTLNRWEGGGVSRRTEPSETERTQQNKEEVWTEGMCVKWCVWSYRGDKIEFYICALRYGAIN